MPKQVNTMVFAASGLLGSMLLSTLFAYFLGYYVKPDVPNSVIFVTASIAGILFGSVSAAGFMLGTSATEAMSNKDLIDM